MRRVLFAAISFALCAPCADVPQRIVSLSPDLTEVLYGIGAFSRVVGVSDYDTYPPEVAKLPHLGPLHSPNLETLTALHPDLVVINSAQAAFVEDTLNQLGLRIFKASNRTLEEVYASILAIGRATGNDSQAAKLVAATRASLDRVARRTARLPKTRVVLIIDRTPGTLRDLYTATEGSFLSELIEISGGHLVVQPAKTGYAKLSKEDLLAVNPDIILDFIQGPKSRFAGDPIEAWSEMPELKAVRSRRVYGVNDDFVPHASQRIVQTVELFARLIHPEAK
jgi:iron complex transport system substrate-binding protein